MRAPPRQRSARSFFRLLSFVQPSHTRHPPASLPGSVAALIEWTKADGNLRRGAVDRHRDRGATAVASGFPHRGGGSGRGHTQRDVAGAGCRTRSGEIRHASLAASRRRLTLSDYTHVQCFSRPRSNILKWKGTGRNSARPFSRDRLCDVQSGSRRSLDVATSGCFLSPPQRCRTKGTARADEHPTRGLCVQNPFHGPG